MSQGFNGDDVYSHFHTRISNLRNHINLRKPVTFKTRDFKYLVYNQFANSKTTLAMMKPEILL